MDIRCPNCGASVGHAKDEGGRASTESDGRDTRSGAIIGALAGGAAGALAGGALGAASDASRAGGGSGGGSTRTYTCPSCGHSFTAAG